MGIISLTNKINNKPYSGSKKAFADALAWAANQYIESPINGEKMTYWQAAAVRLMSTAVFAESDKDATSAMKVARDTLIGRPAVQSEKQQEEIERVAFVVKPEEIKALDEKIAQQDGLDDDEVDGVTIDLHDGSRVVL